MIAGKRDFYEEQVRKEEAKWKRQESGMVKMNKRIWTVHTQDVTNAPNTSAQHAEAPKNNVNSSNDSESEDESGASKCIGPRAASTIAYGGLPSTEMILESAEVSHQSTKSLGKKSCTTTSSKWLVSKTLVLFVNAHHLEGELRCHGYHMNKFSDNDKTGKSYPIGTIECQLLI